MNIKVLSINSPDIVSETIDGEVVIVNLQQGYYYSLLNTATEIWNKIEAGVDYTSLIQELWQSYDTSAEEITEATDEFIKTLAAENLISINTVTKQEKESFLSTEAPLIEKKKHFQAPQVTKFTDMEELLLLDPIHEVEEEIGWPVEKNSPN